MCTFICAGILVQAPFASAFGFFLLVVVVFVSRLAYKALLFELPRDYVRV